MSPLRALARISSAGALLLTAAACARTPGFSAGLADAATSAGGDRRGGSCWSAGDEGCLGAHAGEYDVQGFQARNAAHGFSVRFDPDGPSFHAPSVGWRVDLVLRRLGCPGALRAVAPAVRDGDRNRVEYRRGPQLTEWYVNGPGGLEQGFTLAAPPTCAELLGDVALELEVGGDLAPSLAAGGDEVVLRDAARERMLRYGDLHVMDAAGHELPAHLALEGPRLRLSFASAGAVYPVTVDPLVTQEAKLLADDGAFGDWFGGSVSVAGDTAVVGAPYRDSETGAAYVFVRDAGTWTQQAKLIASDPAGGDHLGGSVSVAGGTAVVSAPLKDSETGAAYVFVRSGGRWTQQAKLVASDSAAFDRFASDVSISGDTAVVGAPYWDSEIGAAYVFVRDGTTWRQQAQLLASDGAQWDDFGQRVSISGDTAVIAAPDKDEARGAAYVFVRSGTTWTQQAKLVASDGGRINLLGWSVSVAGDTAVIGAPTAVSGNVRTGAAYVFVRTGATWTQQAKLLAGDAVAEINFGGSVSIAGDMAVIGADQEPSSTYWGMGAAYIFLRGGTTWTQQAKLLASDGVGGDWLGSSVSVGGDTAIIGACGWNYRTGAAYVFTITRVIGDPCTSPVDCPSGFCVDDVCCNEACDSPCHFCQLPGSVGTCIPVPDDEDPRQECRAAGGGEACAGRCVSQQCMYPGVATSCGLCAACDGTGRCAEATADDDACEAIECSALDTACRSFENLTTNRCAALGVCKPANDPSTCTQSTDVACWDGGTGRQDGGSPVGDGGTSGLPSRGCGCAVGSRPTPSAGVVTLLIALALLGSLRRERGAPSEPARRMEVPGRSP